MKQYKIEITVDEDLRNAILTIDEEFWELIKDFDLDYVFNIPEEKLKLKIEIQRNEHKYFRNKEDKCI